MKNSTYYQIQHSEQFLGIHFGKKKKTSSKPKESVIERLKFAVLLPFEPLMKAILNKKGISYKNDIADISMHFYELITGKSIPKRYSFDDDVEHFAFLAAMPLIISIVKAISSFFKSTAAKAQAKALAGQTLTPAEKLAMQASQKVQQVTGTGTSGNGTTPPKPQEKKSNSALLTLAGLFAASKLLK